MLDLSSLGRFYRRNEIWVIYFFNPKMKECQDFKDEYISMADKLYGILKVAAIDCLTEEELCEDFGVYDIPQVMVFTENYSDDGERYRGKMQWKNISNFAAQKM